MVWKKISNLFSIHLSIPSCLATLISLLIQTLKRKVNMRKELNDSMIICVKSISNFMCISSSVSHELCGHAKGQERNLSTLFGSRTKAAEANYFGGDTWFYIFAKHIFLQPLWENVKFGEWKNDCLFCIKETFISEKWNSQFPHF